MARSADCGENGAQLLRSKLASQRPEADETASAALSSERIPTTNFLNRIKCTFLRFVRYGLLAAIFLLNACSTAGDAEPAIDLKPTLLPLKFTITPSGVVVTGDRTIVTPLGLISIGAKINLPSKDDDAIRVIIRDRDREGIGFDEIYDIKAGYGSFEAVTNGTTVIQVTAEREVIIDVTDAQIESIELRKVVLANFEDNAQGLSRLSERWDEHWQTLPIGYHAWSLTRWAYDDSTIDKWYGVGFVAFLMRLIIATLLAIIDFALVIAFFFGGIFYLFSETARNVCYGFLVIFIIVALWVASDL